MPDQFVVPQFIDAEDKIFGPITARQFIILMIMILTDFALFKLLPFVYFLAVAIPFFAFGIILAFIKINGQPFHYFLLNLIQTFKKPRLRIWDKKKTNEQLKYYMKKKEEVVLETFVRKEAVTTSRLQELSLVVNTGGVYQPDE